MSDIIKYTDVILPLAVKGSFTYIVPPAFELSIGQRVVVQFGHRKLYTAIVLKIHNETPQEYDTKSLLAILDEGPLVNEKQLQFWQWISSYYMCNLSDVMNAALPSSFKLASESNVIIHPEFDGDIQAFSVDESAIVNALLHHCGENLSGIGGVRRPGIVHRIDKGTSGLLVVAKTDLSHRKLSEQFSAHSIERKYSALIYGNPDIESLRLRGLIGISFEEKRVIKISGKIARHKYDRKKMTVNNSLGRRAVTRIKEEKIFGSKEKPFATLLDCWLETGRTHQIRAHLNYLGFGLIGDLVYSSRTGSKKNINKEIFESVKNFNRPALHARELGFIHPRTGELLNFKSDLPTDMEQLLHKFYEIS